MVCVIYGARFPPRKLLGGGVPNGSSDGSSCQTEADRDSGRLRPRRTGTVADWYRGELIRSDGGISSLSRNDRAHYRRWHRPFKHHSRNDDHFYILQLQFVLIIYFIYFFPCSHWHKGSHFAKVAAVTPAGITGEVTATKLPLHNRATSSAYLLHIYSISSELKQSEHQFEFALPAFLNLVNFVVFLDLNLASIFLGFISCNSMQPRNFLEETLNLSESQSWRSGICLGFKTFEQIFKL